MKFWDEVRMAICVELVGLIIKIAPKHTEGMRLIICLYGWLEESLKKPGNYEKT